MFRDLMYDVMIIITNIVLNTRNLQEGKFQISHTQKKVTM